MSICAECKAQFGRSCCELPVGSKPSMPLSLPEVARIATHTKKAMSEFTVTEEVDEDEVAALSKLGEAYEKSLARNTRVRLKTVATDCTDTVACVFLEKGVGCSLPKDVRPYGCRLYPFNYHSKLAKSAEGGIVRDLPSGMCLAHIVTDGDDEKLASLLDTNLGQLTLIGKQREADAKKHEEIILKSE